MACLRVRGAARGAAGRATVDTMRGGMQQPRTNVAIKEQFAAPAEAQVEQQYEQQNAAYSTLSGCTRLFG
jgi:hypothetical protein